jgi:N4-gp56 family major capsid protein
MPPKTVFLTNDPLTRKKWARELFSVILPAVEFNDLVGKDKNAIVQMSTDLGKGEGDEVTFGIRLPLTGEGRVGTEEVEGNEEKLIHRNFKLTIEELNHAVDTGGKMEEQRVPDNLMQAGKEGLQEWWAGKLSDAVIATLCGDTSFRINGHVFAQACTDPDTDHWMRVNDAASDAALTSADVLDLTFLDRMKQKAENPTGVNCYKVRPIMKGGKAYYRVILHNYVFDRMRQNFNIGQWGDMVRSAQKLASPNVEFEYNGMLVGKSERVKKSPGLTNVYRNILCGSQAAVWAWGGAGDSKSSVMSFVPYERDAKRYINIRGGGIFGVKKVTFGADSSTQKDFGIITGSSWGAPLD